MRWRRAAATWGKGAGLNALAVLPAIPAVRDWLGAAGPPLNFKGLFSFLPQFGAGGVLAVTEGLAALLILDATLTAYHVWWHGPLARLHAFGVHHAVPESEMDWTVGQLFGLWEPMISIPTIWAIILVFGVPLGPMIAVTLTTTLWAMWVHTPPRGWHARIGWIFVTPASHRVHHSLDPAFYGLNCGFVFSWWDRILGTRY